MALVLTVALVTCRGQPPAASGDAGHAPAVATSQPAAPVLDGYRTAIDLTANRVHAIEHQAGRMVIEAGGVGFLKHIDGGWKTSWFLGQRDGELPVAQIAGLSGILFFPLDDTGDGVARAANGDVPLTITLRSLAPKQKLSVFVNEKAAGTIDVPSTMGDVNVVLPGAALQPGENRLRLTFRTAATLPGSRHSAAAISRLVLGAGTGPIASALRSAEATLAGLAKPAFTLPGPGRLSFYVPVPASAKLVLSAGAPGPGASLLVRVVRDGAAPRVLFEGPASPSYREIVCDLDSEAGQAVRIDLVGRGGFTLWAAPRLMVKAPPAPSPPQMTFKQVYVWMVDTLRADKVHAFNPKTRVQTPNYDAFAADATRFAWAQVPGTWSLPSHASILTGVYPGVHGATAHEARLSPSVPFIAELMQKGGYRTGLFSSNGYVSGKWGFDRGWDEIRNFIRENLPNGADYLWKNARAWTELPANRDKKQYLYLATVEPHVIYSPKKEFLARYWTKPYTGPIKPALTGIQLGQIKAHKLKITDTDKAYIEALHDGEITQSDSIFGTFIADLKARGLYDSSAVIVISDHGDEFWDHGDVGHAQGVYQELTHVPMIVRAPGLLPAGRVVEADVEAMDLFPTVLELGGQPIPASTQGASLIPLVFDEVGSGPRAAWSQNLGMTRGLKVARYRLVHQGLGRAELYDEIDDPREQKDVAEARPIALRQMRGVFGLLYGYEDRWRKATWGTAANPNESFYREVGAR